MPAGDKWVARNAGPVVRPYALTGGRTRPASGTGLDLITVIVASSLGLGPDASLGLSPEHRRILGRCRGPATVADVASTTALPLGVVRVLVADLIGQGRVPLLPAPPRGGRPQTC